MEGGPVLCAYRPALLRTPYSLMTSRRSLNKAQAQTTTKRNSGPIAKNHVGKKAYSVAYGVMSPLQTALSYALVVRVERGLSL